MKISSEQEMLDFGTNFAKNHTAKVIELIGDVGAGKTTFTRGFAKGLGIKSPITSPSFTISKSYATPDGLTLTHYDFYRLKDPGLMQSDLAEKLSDKNQIIIIEWAGNVKSLLPASHTTITFTKNDDDTRTVNISGPQNILFSGQSGGYDRPLQETKRKKNLFFFPRRRQADDPKDRGMRGPNPVTTGARNLVPENKIFEAKQDHCGKLYLDTSTPTTILRLDNTEYKWNSGHDLAEGLLGFIRDTLATNHQTFHDLTEITFMSGPGSFTGLRIGAAVVNTLAHELNIPLYDHHGQEHQIIIPDYGRPANISKPKK
ncbi:tRNA (adenosine(37)-N6)-threonylcarbamoyltransferase complex ATPase subunit type 1 TsaE [Candidatus Saccharibacteria bacterium]|nr:tRNA (adenosine(37)-N6)-threonylcarbamoyltransferase complex ATPase subunit type 1 TsaE [Candidatus Saccharibacteria bacterium]